MNIYADKMALEVDKMIIELFIKLIVDFVSLIAWKEFIVDQLI